MNDNYLRWVATETRTHWWHDSAEAGELDLALERGAGGVTTNPVLTAAALKSNPERFSAAVKKVIAESVSPEAKAEALMRILVTDAARKLAPHFETGDDRAGYVCAQVNPLQSSDREAMVAMGRRLHAWAPNIAVKLPTNAAGLDVLEDLVAEGITVTATVSFTVPQVVAAAERHRAGIERARAKGVEPGKCFAVIMIGRLDDYLRDVARESEMAVEESDIRQAGLAATKRAYAIYQERNYEAVLLIAALRGPYHLTELAGADLLMSIHPSYQQTFVSDEFPREERITHPVDDDVIERLSRMPEFVRAYEPDAPAGLAVDEFAGFGATQLTLNQFCEAGWRPLENHR